MLEEKQVFYWHIGYMQILTKIKNKKAFMPIVPIEPIILFKYNKLKCYWYFSNISRM